jgi:hypothetical protein
MEKEVSPYFSNLTYDGLIKSFWYKRDLKKFLRGCGIASTFINTWQESDTSKREFLDRLFSALQGDKNGNAVITKIGLALSEQNTFPGLQNIEDSLLRIKEATVAVEALKVYINQQNDILISEKEKEVNRQKAREESCRIQRVNTDRDKLKQRLESLHTRIGTQQAGYDFQDWFYDLLDYCEIQNRRPYNSHGRQIDGSLTLDGTTYLVELKFQKTQAGAEDIDSLKAKVATKADNTMGLMVSISGYSSVAVQEASGSRTTLLLMDFSHLYSFLMGNITFGEILSRIRRHASQTGEAYLMVSQFGG